jgi:hypothetical protein
MTPERRTELLRDLDRDTGWVLLVEGVEQSYVDVTDPTHLEFEYMQHIALLLDAMFTDRTPLSAVHLGGGALTMPRWFVATHPGSRQVVVESSDDVVATTASLVTVPACDVVVGDAIRVAADLAAASYDVVIWDLYDGPRAVTSSLTLESIAVMRRLVRDDTGLLLFNISDAAPFDVVRPVLSALRELTADVVLLAEPSTLRGRRSGNCILAGTASRRVPVAALGRAAAAAPVRARVLSRRALEDFVGDAAPATEADPLPLPDESRGRAFL